MQAKYRNLSLSLNFEHIDLQSKALKTNGTTDLLVIIIRHIESLVAHSFYLPDSHVCQCILESTDRRSLVSKKPSELISCHILMVCRISMGNSVSLFTVR